MRYGSAVALVVLALTVTAVLAGPALLPSFDDWGSPVIHETLGDESWKSRWGIRSGRLELRKGRLITSGDKESRIVLRERMGGPLAVEFTAEILPGARPCDLTVNWYEQATFAEDGSVSAVGGEWQLQLGAFDNAYSCIIDPRNRLIAYSDFILTVGKSYRIRAEFGDDDLRLLADGREILRAGKPYPLANGHLGLRFYYPGKAISDITVWRRPVHDPATALGQAEGLARESRFAEAALAYGQAAKEASPALRGSMLHGAARSWDLAKDEAASPAAWAALRGTDHESLAVLHDLELAFAAGDHAAVTSRFPAAYRACPARFRDQYALSWSTWIGVLGQRWLPLPIYQDYLDAYLASLTDNPLADRAASGLLLLLKRNEEVVARFPRQAQICTRALIEMGRPDEALKRFRDVPLVSYIILSELGRYNEALLEGPVWSVPITMLEMGKNEEVIQQYADQPIRVAIALQNLGRLQEVIDRFPELTAIKADCLGGLGRFDEAMALVKTDEERKNLLLRMGRAREAMTLCERDFASQQTARDLLGLQACIAGRLDEAKQWFTPNTPYVYGWPTFGFRYYILEAALLGQAGDAATRDQRLREAATMTTVWHGSLPKCAAVLTGEMPLDEAAQTMRHVGLVALAIAQEQAKAGNDALATYRRYLAEVPRGDPVVQHFAAWRIETLSRSGPE